jgi:hypothetical protein
MMTFGAPAAAAVACMLFVCAVRMSAHRIAHVFPLAYVGKMDDMN